MGETQTPHFYDFWIFEPVTKPQNQQFLSLETPGHLKQIKKTPGTFFKYCFYKCHFLEMKLQIFILYFLADIDLIYMIF